VELFMLDKVLGSKVANFFTILGGLVAIFSFYLSYIVIVDDGAKYTSSGLYKVQEAAADILAPPGYVINPSLLGFVPSGNDFATSPNKPLLITDQKVPFILMPSSTDTRASVKLDGSSRTIPLGDKLTIRNSGCALWLYSIEQKNYSFKMLCS
jgi:hypothetical protein